ncbi:hypothetical protein [Streptomyces sp. KL116D]|uniref:hypothetical protein n=1 Tax=Streptomyces sp. KL116D TaxID=3045152 RepID=UPI0035585C45
MTAETRTPQPLTDEQLAEIQADVAAYGQHPEIGFACCSAHRAADVAPALLAEVDRLKRSVSAALVQVRQVQPLDTYSANRRDLAVRILAGEEAPEPDAEVDRLAAELAKVAEFVAKRAEYITAINGCHNDADYWRWQGHAESRRQLAQELGLPVAWPAEYEGATT